jgi:hypothetical protein
MTVTRIHKQFYFYFWISKDIVGHLALSLWIAILRDYNTWRIIHTPSGGSCIGMLTLSCNSHVNHLRNGKSKIEQIHLHNTLVILLCPLSRLDIIDYAETAVSVY